MNEIDIYYRSLLMRIPLGPGHRASRAYWRLGGRRGLRNMAQRRQDSTMGERGPEKHFDSSSHFSRPPFPHLIMTG